MRFLVFCCIGVFLAACQTSFAPTPTSLPTNDWVSLNKDLPTHAPVLALTYSPAEPAKLYAGAYDNVGLYVSTDDGASWRADNVGLPPAPVFFLLWQDRTLYAGTAAGLYRRTEGALIWQLNDVVPRDVAVYGLASLGNTLYAATDGRGIYATSDQGKSWSRLPGLDDEILLSVLPLDSQTIFAGTSGQGLFLTRDAGAHWQLVGTFSGAYVSLLAAGAADPKTVFARTRGGLYLSSDLGTTWKKFSGGLENEIVNAMLFSNDDGETNGKWIAATSGNGVMLSDDKGETWRAAISNIPKGQAVLALKQRGNNLFAGTSDGVARSDDGGETWRGAGEGVGAPAIHALVTVSEKQKLLLGTDDGLYEWNAISKTMRKVASDSFESPVLSLAVAPRDHNRIYLGTSGKGIFVSNDGGDSWKPVGGELEGRLRVPGLTADPTAPDVVFARILFERMFKSSNGGDSWHTVWSGMSQDVEVETMAFAPSDTNRMYAGGNDAIFCSNDGGERWVSCGLYGVSTLAIWVDPEATNRVLAGTTDGLYESLDGGSTWNGPRLRGVTITDIERTGQGIIYIGTKYHGIFSSADNAQSFQPVGSGLEDASIVGVAINQTQDLLYAATTRGLFEISTK